MNTILESMKSLNTLLWSGPLLFLLMGTHLFFTFKLRFIQKKVGKGIRLSVKTDETSSGTSSFAALSTTLAATLGVGNIIGVSTAVALGGPGAIFWCWITGVFGMATTYAECYLGVLFRKKDANGNYSGGPMYTLEYGLKSKFLGSSFALLTIVAAYGIGCSTQSNSISETIQSLWGFSPYVIGIITAIITGLVIIGGISSIGKICTRLVPAMGIFYIIACIILLVINSEYILPSISLIMRSAFLPSAMAGGFVGSTLKAAARLGITRGLFTNEAGIGTAAIAAASANTKSPYNQALVSMTATFWDTVVICAITGIVIVSNILRNPQSIQGYGQGELTTAAFEQIPYGGEILSIAIVLFALATLIGWSYFGERAVEYLFGPSGINTYRICYIIMIFVGAVLSLEFVWELSDLISAFMIVPNVIALLFLSRLIKHTE